MAASERAELDDVVDRFGRHGADAGAHGDSKRDAANDS
jgi:hypothetical protein